MENQFFLLFISFLFDADADADAKSSEWIVGQESVSGAWLYASMLFLNLNHTINNMSNLHICRYMQGSSRDYYSVTDQQHLSLPNSAWNRTPPSGDFSTVLISTYIIDSNNDNTEPRGIVTGRLV